MKSCSMNKPILYDMMLNDFIELSHQYKNNDNMYIFNLNSNINYINNVQINELLNYMFNNDQEINSILIKTIHKRYPNIHLNNLTINSMIDYYIECLYLSLNE